MESIEKVFRYLQVFTACYVAFAHSSNDVANAVATWGYRVIKMVGENITQLTFTRGFSAEFATATTVISASTLGLPISTTHVGNVIGVGLAGGLASVNLKVVQKIIFSWILTLPITTFLSIGVYTVMVTFI